MHSDKPVTDQASDRFQRYNFAKRIAESILNLLTKDSLCIGLYGQWGEGKTSVIEFVSRELAQKAVIVRFNPWQSTSDQVLLSYFFDEVASSLDIQIEGWRDKAAKLVQNYGAILSTVPYVSKDVTDTLGKIISKTTLASQRKAVIDALLEADQPVVVFVDDIDRLALSEIQAVFKLVKSVADFPNVIYVLALDPDRVAEALKPTFGDGHGYLEKIIQIPLTLPKVQYAALRQYTYEQIDKAINQPTLTISEEELRFFKANYEKHLANFVQLPRDPVRIGNSIMFALPMLNGEVHMGDLMLLETIKVLLPDLYSSIRNSRSVYLSTYSTGIQRITKRMKTRRRGLKI